MLHTPKLHLRNWQDADKALFAKMNSDPDVMRYFPNPLNQEQSDAMVDKCQQLICQNGYGFWAAEHKADKRFIGMIGLHHPKMICHFRHLLKLAGDWIKPIGDKVWQ